MAVVVTQKKHGRGFPLIDVAEPELNRDVFPYSQIPRITFDGKFVLPDLPDDIWITDTTFRDGQQARPPYTPKQIIDIYELLHRLGGKSGVIRQSEFFLYSDRDREAVEGCMAKGYEFPEVTGWIRANSSDLKIVNELNIKETGILTSVSDYHIFLKLKKKRSKAMEDYVNVVKAAIDSGIRPRCHFEDITRADIYGFCLPFAEELLNLSERRGVPVKVRLCDTMGYGVTYPGATLPRSVPKLVQAFTKELGYPSELLEWHGHNDFHKVHANAGAAWVYGISSLNASLLGYGERTGNPPLEAAMIEYIGLTGNTEGIDTRVITEIADYFSTEVKAQIPSNYPFVGSDFNTTRAGIHADGIMKNPEIYNIFDTGKILGRELKVTVTDKSGMAGIAQWINENIPSILSGENDPVSKRHTGIKHINDWVSEQYEHGRTTGISPEELVAQAKHFLPSLFVSDFQKALDAAEHKARFFAQKISSSKAVMSLSKKTMDPFLHDVVRAEGSIQLLAMTDTDGRRITQVHTQRGKKSEFRNLLSKDFTKHAWFIAVVESGEPYYSDLFFSKFTGRLIMTAALPIYDKNQRLKAVMDIDFIFDELVKLESPIPDEILESRIV